MKAKNVQRKGWFILLAGLLFSCSPLKDIWIAPSYTDISKITQLRGGMTIPEVNTILGIQPYDVYVLSEDQTTVLVYNYLKKARIVEVPSGELEKVKRSKEGLTRGEDYYLSDSPSRLFVLFKDQKFESLITDAGREDAEWLVLDEKMLQLLNADELGCYPCSEEELSEMVYVNPVPEQTVTVNQEIKEQGKSKKGGTVFAVIMGILLVGGLLVGLGG